MLAIGAGVGAGVSALWHYNRSNFLYDRKLRQEQEFAIFEWRKVQAELWREDVRDIIEMTEKKMDNYLIVTVLQLGMCAGLFACGRLEPGTPPWLLHFYMLSLGGAFMYLLMSVWLAMHAGVVAQCASVRMLTQFVRLPVPDWNDFEGARTYAHTFETLRLEDMLRVPFTRSLATGDQPAAKTMAPNATGPGYEEWNEDMSTAKGMPAGTSHDSTMATAVGGLATPTPMAAPRSLAPGGESERDVDMGTAGSGGSARRRVGFVEDEEGAKMRHADPWRLEKHGDERGFYELQQVTLEMRRHIRLARRAALQFQCFDAFARLSMSFGTHQLLYAISNYALGYLTVQDGVFWPAVCIVAIMMGISSMMMHVDFSMTRCEQIVATTLVCVGLSSSCAATLIWRMKGAASDDMLAVVLPVTYIANFLWLLISLRSCGITEEPTTGIVLPMKLRAVLYLDVFGWLSKSPAERCTPVSSKGPMRALASERIGSEASCVSAEEPAGEPSPRYGGSLFSSARSSKGEDFDGGTVRPRLQSFLHRLFMRRPKDTTGHSRSRYEPLPQAMFTDVNVGGATFTGFSESKSGGFVADDIRCRGPAGEITHPPDHAFEPGTFVRSNSDDFLGKSGGQEIVTGQDRLRPSKMPGNLFKSGTLLLAFLWAVAFLVPLELLRVYLAKPAIADIYVEKVDENGDLTKEDEIHAVVGTDVNGLPEIRPLVPQGTQKPTLGISKLLHVEWPSHSAFVPRALACDSEGKRIVVADDFALYSGEVRETPAGSGSTQEFDRAPIEARPAHSSPLAAAAPAELFGTPPNQPKTHRTQLSVKFKRAPRCAPLEGIAFDDIGVLCGDGSACDALVLTDRGRTLTECPLAIGATSAKVASAVGVTSSWRIAEDWLDREERIVSVTIGSKSSNQTAFARSPTFVVGTSAGRVVAMTNAPDLSNGHGEILVPKQALEERKDPSTSGSLADVAGKLTLALWYSDSVLSAFDASGRPLGEWLLPNTTYWLMVSAGRERIFLLGVRKAEPETPHKTGEEKPQNGPVFVELHSFELPAELKQIVASATAGSPDAADPGVGREMSEPLEL